MSGLEGYIIITLGALLLTTTGSRFLLQELIAVVKLYKELKAEVCEAPSQQSQLSADIRSKNVSRLPDRESSE